MSDLMLKWEIDSADYVIGAEDESLKTAVIISLFTDRRALPDDELPWEQSDRRGYWGDHDLGSRLWLLTREKKTPNVRHRAIQYARESLEWMTAPDVLLAESVEVDAEWQKGGRLALSISITRPENQPASYRFYLNWEATKNAV